MNKTVTPNNTRTFTGIHNIEYYSFGIVCVLLIFNMVSFYIMATSPKIAVNIRWLCNNIIFYEMMTLLSFILHASIQDHPYWFFFRLDKISLLGSWFGILCFSIERYIAVGIPLSYHRYCKSLYVKRFIVISFTSFVICAVYFRLVTWEEKRGQRICWFGLALHSVFSIIIITTNFKTMQIVRTHVKKIGLMQHGFTNGFLHINRMKESLSCFCTLFVLMHLPVDIEAYYLKCKITPHLRMKVYYLFIIAAVVHPLVFIWRFRECRLRGLLLLSRLPGGSLLDQYVQTRRIQIFNIPVYKNKADQHEQRRDICSIPEVSISKPDTGTKSDVTETCVNELNPGVSTKSDVLEPKPGLSAITDVAELKIFLCGRNDVHGPIPCICQRTQVPEQMSSVCANTDEHIKQHCNSCETDYVQELTPDMYARTDEDQNPDV